MAAAEKYKLLVSGLGGNVYIAKETKQPHVMGLDRRVVPKGEFINAILQWTVPQLEKKADTLQITGPNGLVAEIKIIDKTLLK